MCRCVKLKSTNISMKRILSTFFFVSCFITCMAHEIDNTPLDSVIIEGNITNAPDSTPVHLSLDYGLIYKRIETSYIVNGRFCFVRYSQKDNERYSINTYMNYCNVNAPLGSKTIITGDGINPKFWNVENSGFEQRERNEYLSFIREKLPEYYEMDAKQAKLYFDRFNPNLTQVERDKATNEFRQFFKVYESHREEMYIRPMVDFMEKRPYSKEFLQRLTFMSREIINTEDAELIAKARALYDKIPQEDKKEACASEIRSHLFTMRIEKGEEMPDFVLYDFDDKEHHLNEFKGKYSILEFTSLACAPCIMAKPDLDRLYKKHWDKMELIAISEDAESEWKESDDRKLSYHTWNDHKYASDIKAKYGVSATPTFIIIDPEGKIQDICVGGLEFFKAFVRHIPDAEIEKIISEIKK